jgi:hypothetical protein
MGKMSLRIALMGVLFCLSGLVAEVSAQGVLRPDPPKENDVRPAGMRSITRLMNIPSGQSGKKRVRNAIGRLGTPDKCFNAVSVANTGYGIDATRAVARALVLRYQYR